MKHIDMMGQPCPMPVIQARKALLAGETQVSIDVDNEIAVQNLEKMAHGEGYQFSWERLSQTHYRVLMQGTGTAMPAEAVSECAPIDGMTVVISGETLGTGADELGRLLMKGFVFSLTELPVPPSQMVFLNGGAKLTTSGAATVPDLTVLAQKGTRIYTCGTCANFYGIKDSLAVGEITDMMNIVRIISNAHQLVMP